MKSPRPRKYFFMWVHLELHLNIFYTVCCGERFLCTTACAWEPWRWNSALATSAFTQSHLTTSVIIFDKRNFFFFFEKPSCYVKSCWPSTPSSPPAATSLVLGSQKHHFVDSIVKIFFNSRPMGRPKKSCHILSKQYFAE